MSQLATFSNVAFLFEGLKLTMFIAGVSIALSAVFGIALGTARNSHNGPLKFISGAYIEIVRNIPNLLWIYAVFLIIRLKSVAAGVFSFTLFSSAAVGEIVRGGLNSIDHGLIEAAKSQGFNSFQTLIYIVLPIAMRRVLPTLASQLITMVKDTSFLWSVVAIQELTGKATILMGRYYRADQVFILFGALALVYFIINFGISIIIRKLQEMWAY